MKHTRSFLTNAFLLALALCFITPTHAANNVLFIVDASGSMKKTVDNTQRMEVAKKVLSETLTNMPTDAQLGLLLYGHRKAKDCTDIELVAPIGGEDASSISKTIQALKPIGETPIAESLRKAAKSFKAFKGQQNSIILVTDGIEECKGDPCAAAQELKDAGLDVKVNVVGFTLGEAEGKALQCVADITGGKYYSASNAADLTDALKQVQQQVQETVVVQKAEPPKDDGDILAAKNGGTLVSAPNNRWKDLNQNHEKFSTTTSEGATYAGEGVWSFKEGKPATFARIEVLVPQTYQYNLKDFEVLAGDDLNAPFRSLGQFTAQNVKIMPAGWQAFTFPETTAKYIKVIFKTDQGGGYIGGNALRVIGKINETAAAAQTPKLEGDDVLAAKNGGTLVYAPNDKWQTLNTDNFSRPTYDGEGVWHFRDGKPATLNRIEVQVTNANDYNLKNFEVLTGDSASGPFTAVGAFTVQNARVMPDGWQIFSFAPVTAKFVKIIFKDGHWSYIGGNPLRLFGKIDDAAPAAAKPAAVEGSNLLAQSAGGMLLVGTNDEWNKLNDGKDERAVTYTGEGVWSFAGEKPAIISAVDVLIPAASGYNLKDFEVLVGDEGPTGAFRSIGVFTTQNAKVLPDGYQRFTFPKVQTKYIKLNLKTDHGGGYIAVYEFRVFGTPAP